MDKEPQIIEEECIVSATDEVTEISEEPEAMQVTEEYAVVVSEDQVPMEESVEEQTIEIVDQVTEEVCIAADDELVGGSTETDSNCQSSQRVIDQPPPASSQPEEESQELTPNTVSEDDKQVLVEQGDTNVETTMEVKPETIVSNTVCNEVSTCAATGDNIEKVQAAVVTEEVKEAMKAECSDTVAVKSTDAASADSDNAENCLQIVSDDKQDIPADVKHQTSEVVSESQNENQQQSQEQQEDQQQERQQEQQQEQQPQRRFTPEQAKKLRNLKSAAYHLCKVCGSHAKAARYFGVMACNRCKVTYQRAILLYRIKSCISKDNPGVCLVENKTRSKCLSCFVDKCKKSGMSVTGVKLYWNASMKTLPAGTPACLRTLTKEFRRLFSAYNQIYNDHSIKPELLTDRALEVGSPSYKYFMFSEFCQYYEPLVNSIVQFSKYIPGFDGLPTDDQIILLKTGFMDVWVILSARRLLNVKDCITLHDNTQIPLCEFSTIYSKQYASSLNKVVRSVRKLNLQPAEKAIAVSLALTCSDRPNLIAKRKVQELHTTLLKLHQRLARSTKSKAASKDRNISSMLSSVYNLGKEHSQLVNFYRNQPENLTVSPVIRELFDLHPQQKYKEK